MNKKFIITKDNESAALLHRLGLREIQSDDTYWVFLNDGKLVFENINDITYTDKLFF